MLALSRPGVNGVLGTPDILEDLLLLGALDDKVVFGSMNRGGLAGATWSLDDRFTAYDAGGDRARPASRAARCCCGSTRRTRAPRRRSRRARTPSRRSRERRLIAMVEPFWSDHDAPRAR